VRSDSLALKSICRKSQLAETGRGDMKLQKNKYLFKVVRLPVSLFAKRWSGLYRAVPLHFHGKKRIKMSGI
jgi:hypothetical protein